MHVLPFSVPRTALLKAANANQCVSHKTQLTERTDHLLVRIAFHLCHSDHHKNPVHSGLWKHDSDFRSLYRFLCLFVTPDWRVVVVVFKAIEEGALGSPLLLIISGKKRN